MLPLSAGNLWHGERWQAVILHLHGSRNLSSSCFQGMCLTLSLHLTPELCSEEAGTEAAIWARQKCLPIALKVFLLPLKRVPASSQGVGLDPEGVGSEGENPLWRVTK